MYMDTWKVGFALAAKDGDGVLICIYNSYLENMIPYHISKEKKIK